MEALESGYARKGTGAIYWCGFGDGEIPDSVHALLDKSARECPNMAVFAMYKDGLIGGIIYNL
jgi:hypothetical protein